jgi:hypothetical protein
MSELVDRDRTIATLLDHVQHNTDAAVHCLVEIEPGEFVVTRTREQAVHLRGALAVLRAQLVTPEPTPEPPPAVEPVTSQPEVKRGPGRPRKTTAAPTGD